MSRVALVHWKKEEAGTRVQKLRSAGHTVRLVVPEDAASLKGLFSRPPEAVIIDFSRRPGEGIGLGALIRQRKATRNVPLVFAGDDEERLTRVRKAIPDAVCTPWSRIRGAIDRAIRNPPGKPVVPGVFAAYSGTPLPKKLGVKPGQTVALLGAPAGFEKMLGELPEGVTIRRQARGAAELILLFCRSQADLDRRFPGASRTLAPGGRLWIAWPKQASGMKTDLTQVAVRKHGLDRDLVDFKICSVDDTWSGLAFARRKNRS